MKVQERKSRKTKVVGSDVRQRRQQIQRLSETIAREFQPERIILVGSYAYGL